MKSARTLLLAAPRSGLEDRRRIVVNDFKIVSPGNVTDNTGKRLSAELRTRLAENNLNVLDRLSLTQVASEHTLNEMGLVSENSAEPLLGADWVVAGTYSPEGNTLQLSVLDVAAGRRLRQESFALMSQSAELPEQAMKWVIGVVSGDAAAKKLTWKRSSKVEALEPLYRGISLFHEGKFLDAAAEFEKSADLDDRQVNAFIWEKRCYEAAGLQPVADAVKVYLDRHFDKELGNLAALPPNAGEGIVFLGIADRSGDPASCRKLEILTTDAATEPRMLLATDVASLRDEYDALAGVRNSRGVTWNEEPGLLAQRTLAGILTQTDGKPTLQYFVSDTVRGTVLSKEIRLDSNHEGWKAQLRQPLADLLSQSSTDSARKIPMAPLPTAQELIPQLGRDGNRAVLKLALVDPGVLAEHRPVLKKREWYYQLALEYGLREYLISQLPPSHPLQPWLELCQIEGWLPYTEINRTCITERQEDGIALLREFVQAHPKGDAGALAEYMLLWDTMPHIPYPELEKRFAALSSRCLSTDEPHQPRMQIIAKFSEHLRTLAIIAQDDPSRRLPLPSSDFPVRMRTEFNSSGRLSIVMASWWHASEWKFFEVSPQDAVHEARAAIAFLGRGTKAVKTDPAWFRDFPHSHALLCFGIESLRKVDVELGLPLHHPFDADAEKAEYREMTSFIFNEIRREIQNAEKSSELDQLESYEIRRFLTALVHPGFTQTVPDSEFNAMKDAFAADIASAEQRLGRTQRQRYERIWLDWRKIDRATSPFLDPAISRENQEAVYDEEAMKAQAQEAAQQPAGARLFDTEWKQTVHRYEYVSQPSKKRVEICLAQFPRLRAEGVHPQAAEMRWALEFAHTLLNGKHEVEAEELFRKIWEIQPSFADKALMDIRANAAFHLARILMEWGRKPEAMTLLKEIVTLSADHSIQFEEDGSWHGPTGESLETKAAQKLAEIRDEKPTVTKNRVTVKPPGAFSEALSFDFRPPTGNPTGPLRVLLLGNADDLAKWGAFADRHQLFLFALSHRNPEAALQALEELKLNYPICTDRLLLHGRGGGARTVEEFALKKPELCAALSVHCCDDLLWDEQMPSGFHPLVDLKAIPVFATCGKNKETFYARYDKMVQFVTMARGAGVPVIWKELPHTRRRNSPDLDKTAQAFLGGCLGDDKDLFIGDLLSGTFYPEVDPRAAAIPKNLRVQLPGRAVAECWGTEK